MPRLTRKNIKVFAGSATNNGVFGSLQANNPTTTSDVEQLQSLSAWSEGWNAATETSEELPPLEEIQGVEYVTTYQQAYIMQEGVPEWAATVTYYKGCLTKEVTSTGFKIYNSLTDNNTGNLLSDTSNWKKVMDSDDLYAFDNTVVHKTGNETITGVKTFKGDNRIAVLQNSTVTYNTAPSSDTFTDISFRDKNGYEMGVLEHVRYANNNTAIRMVAKGADGVWSTSLTVGRRADGTVYASAPTPTAGDNSQQIATTAFVQTSVNTRTTPSDVSAAISTTLAALYPVGSIYIGTQSTCPLASLISGSQWQLVAQDRALWGGNGSNANSTINAGLPNITGYFGSGCLMNWQESQYGGALYRGTQGTTPQNAGGTDGGTNGTIAFDASRSNSIYGSSSTVQPPAYRVNVWRRTA